MILQSLVKYYEILAEDENSDIPRLGYSRTGVSYALNISKDGELLGVIPLKVPGENGKKMVPQRMIVPEQEKKSVGIKSNFLCENSSYILGTDNNGKPERTRNCFEAFKELHNKILKNVECAEAKSLLNFINKWDIDNAASHVELKDYLEDIYTGANIVFRLDGGGYIHQNKTILKAWEEYKNNSEGSKRMQCLDSGEYANVARLHPNIKGVRGAQSVGAAIVSFNDRAYESYGREKEQGLNSPVSEYAAFAYTTVLNNMLSDNAHKQYLGDTTVVFWAESPKRYYQDFASMFIDPDEFKDGDNSKFERDKGAAAEVKLIFEKISNGAARGDYLSGFDKNVKFYILGLAPNAARLSIRFFIMDSFGGFIEKIARHYEDLCMEKQFQDEQDLFSLWRLLNETVSPKSNDKAASPILSGAVLRAILTGSPYPAALFNSVMVRIRAEHSINHYKAAIIKAYLLRNSNKYKEVLTVSLNEQSNNRAYVLGRLFAVLEKAQQDASDGQLKATIKDRYFTSACATPASVFPILLRLSQHHISKAEYGKANDIKVSRILDMLDIEQNPIPAHLSLEQQGVFVLGYYHQKNALYKKNN
ncbi:CRISPR-associated protein [Ruminiclostridium hungatei]|uniref:CRISPR-associated protein n=1 Tax=Ruminiclostridium hungatei TaxID=48256 RepID=A0A1V4SKU2_RUMHU|nr:type I-C CRISPR-associated protein Cas8c/Csd1 [Ruminiclostridium hungatei]OPX44509.1 CRISPR-associated protein [Ruminiclostridium hungatei]